MLRPSALGPTPQVLALQKELQALDRQHSKALAQLSEVGAEVRSLRGEREAREREALSLRRNLERLLGEKESLEAASASDAAYIRRLESTVASLHPEKGAAAARRAAEAEAQLACLRSALREAEEAGAAAAQEVRALQAALELRAEELGC